MSENTSSEGGLELSDDDANNLLADSDGNSIIVPNSDTSDTEADPDWKTEAAKLRAEAAKWQGLARKHEGRAKENAAAAQKAKTVEQQLEELRNQVSERDKREAARSERLALAQLNTRLAESGIKRDDVSGLLRRISASQLLANGEPDDKAIGELADSLVKIAGRATPDPDQGKKGGSAPMDMNQLIRRSAGYIQ